MSSFGSCRTSFAPGLRRGGLRYLSASTSADPVRPGPVATNPCASILAIPMLGLQRLDVNWGSNLKSHPVVISSSGGRSHAGPDAWGQAVVRVYLPPGDLPRLLVALPALDGLTLGGWSGIPSGWPARR